MHSQKSFFYSLDQLLHLIVPSVVENFSILCNCLCQLLVLCPGQLGPLWKPFISAPMLSSNSFAGPGLTVRPLTHFQLFLHIMRDSRLAPLFWVTFPSHLLWTLFSKVCFWRLCHTQQLWLCTSASRSSVPPPFFSSLMWTKLLVFSTLAFLKSLEKAINQSSCFINPIPSV